MMETINLYNPKKLVFGKAALDHMAMDCIDEGLKRVFIITIPAIEKQLINIKTKLNGKGVQTETIFFIDGEPTFKHYEEIKKQATHFKADCIAGIGGGSVMDLAKIVAALLYSVTDVNSVVGINVLKERNTHLICAPTTSGTGSEVSPNAILMDENDFSKKGIISRFLVPDAAYVDPVLTLNLPKNVTAFTGIDALTHCIEAYANRFAHPIIDQFALQGISLIGKSLLNAFNNTEDLNARCDVALGSLYGGMCLGPVNTAAVHALAYPLGSMYKLPHGLANAILLPYVIEYNLDAAVHRYADIALALGAEKKGNPEDIALQGIKSIKQLITNCGIKMKLSDYNINRERIEEMAGSAFQVQRLLKNNVKHLEKEDIIEIYKTAY